MERSRKLHTLEGWRAARSSGHRRPFLRAKYRPPPPAPPRRQAEPMRSNSARKWDVVSSACVCVIHMKPFFLPVDVQPTQYPVSILHSREIMSKLCGKYSNYDTEVLHRGTISNAIRKEGRRATTTQRYYTEVLHSNAVRKESRRCTAMSSYSIRQAQHKDHIRSIIIFHVIQNSTRVDIGNKKGGILLAI